MQQPRRQQQRRTMGNTNADFHPSGGSPADRHAWSLTIGVMGDNNVPHYWLRGFLQLLQIPFKTYEDVDRTFVIGFAAAHNAAKAMPRMTAAFQPTS